MLTLKNGQREHRIWVKGFPKSQQSSSFERYRENIRCAAREKFPTPLGSGQIEIEVVFADKRTPRPDVDNVPKPILDALKGIVYRDDAQVVSATGKLIPVRDDLRVTGTGAPHNTFVRLFDQDEFLIRVRERRFSLVLEEVESS